MYVSAKWVKTVTPEGTEEERICATDDQGVVWWIPSEDCDVGAWVEYKAAGGTIDPAEEAS